MLMKSMKISAVLAVCAVAAASALAFAGELKAFLKAEIPKSAKAFENKNIAYFEACSTADFTYTDIKGKTQPKKEAMAGLKSMFDQSKSIKCTMRLVSVKETDKGGTIVVDNKYDTETMPGPDKKTHHMVMGMTTQEVWVKQGKAYKLKSIKEVKMGQMLMDGKPMSMGAQKSVG